MIIMEDALNSFEKIKKLSLVAYEFLVNFDKEIYANGRLELENNVYVNIEEYETKERKERKFESHKKYIDIQYMIEGEELITIAPVNELDICIPYNEEDDITYYRNKIVGYDFLLKSGCFIILNPNEGHMPCICVNEKQKVRKLVIKIPI